MQRHSERARRRQAQAHVLEAQSRREAEVEAARQHRARPLVLRGAVRPLEALSTSIMRAGSSPARAPIAMPSAVIAMAQAPSRLLTSFMHWPAPGFVPR